MHKHKNKIYSWIGVGVLVIVMLLAIQTYVKRGVCGRLRSASDDMGVQYEPYYLKAEGRMRDAAVYPSVQKGKAPVSAPMPRKLIRTGDLRLRVDDCEKTLPQILAIVNSFQGLIIDSQVNKYANLDKSGTTVFKVLPKDFDAVLQRLKSVGKVEYEKISGEDVTEQYVDLQARLDNFMRVKGRLVKILDEKAREVKDILEIERELARVGGEIEVIEGRLKYLDRQVDLATISVYFYEKKVVVLGSLNFKEKFKETIRTAIETSVNVFNSMIIFTAAVIPVAVWVGVILLIALGIRKLFRKK